MRIANPLYDTAFKYMMSNERIARKVLSTILNEEVVELDLLAQEIVSENDLLRFTIYRLDFKATILGVDGKRRQVLIELQKSKLPTNLLRFRSYLGENYREKKAAKLQDSASNAVDQPLPIVAIYILGYNLVDIPLLATVVDKKIIDAVTQQEVQLESDFIDLLTHRCYILQVRRLPPERRTRLERFMALFNQAQIAEENYILDLDDVPKGFADVAKRLARPLLDEQARRNLDAESEVEMLFANQEAQLASARQQTEQAKQQTEQAKQQTEQAKRQAEQARKQAEQARQQAEQARQQAEQAKRRAEQAKQRPEQAEQQNRALRVDMARTLLQLGIDVDTIRERTGLTKAEIEALG